MSSLVREIADDLYSLDEAVAALGLRLVTLREAVQATGIEVRDHDGRAFLTRHDLSRVRQWLRDRLSQPTSPDEPFYTLAEAARALVTTRPTLRKAIARSGVRGSRTAKSRYLLYTENDLDVFRRHLSGLYPEYDPSRPGSIRPGLRKPVAEEILKT